MKAKKFVAPDMRQALKLVRDNMGADAVILSNRKVAGGVEVSVAMDYRQAMEDHRQGLRKEAHIPQFTDGSAEFTPPSGDSTRMLKETLLAAKDKERRDDVRAMLDRQRKQLDEGAHSGLVNSYQRENVALSPDAQIKQRSDERVKRNADKLMPPAQPVKRPVESYSAGYDTGYDERYEQSQDRRYAREIEEDSYVGSGQGRANRDNSNGSSLNTSITSNTIEPKKRSFFDEYENRVDEELSETQMPTVEPATTELETTESATTESAQSARNPLNDQLSESQRAFDEPINSPPQDVHQMRSELQQLRSMINSQLGNVAWGDFSYRHPVSAAIFKRLMRMGLTSSLARSLSQQVDSQASMKDGWHQVLVNLSSRLPMLDASLTKKEGMIAFVGAAGVGKTTTIAKLAAEYVLEHGPENIALVTTDSYRIAGHEQLRVLSKILKIPLRVVAGNQSLESVLRGLNRKKMVLIDTAGLSHKDTLWTEQIAQFESTTMAIQKWLVLSTTSQQRILDKAVMDYKTLGLDGCVLTKLDESASLGEALSVVIEHQLSVAYTTNGQNIPEDIEQAKPRNLVNKAIALTKEAVVDDELAADYFNESMKSENGEFTAA